MDFVSSFSMMYCSISYIKEQSSLKSQKYLQITEKSHKRTVVQGGARGRGEPRGCGRPRGRGRPRVARNIQPRGCGRGQGRPWVETAGVIGSETAIISSAEASQTEDDNDVQDVDEIAVEHNVGAIGSGAAIFWVKKLSQKVKKRLRKVRKRMKGWMLVSLRSGRLKKEIVNNLQVIAFLQQMVWQWIL